MRSFFSFGLTSRHLLNIGIRMEAKVHKGHIHQTRRLLQLLAARNYPPIGHPFKSSTYKTEFCI